MVRIAIDLIHFFIVTLRWNTESETIVFRLQVAGDKGLGVSAIVL